MVDLYYPYNVILGRGFTNKFNAVIHMGYLCMKIPAFHGIISLHGSQKDARNIEKAIYKAHKSINSVQASDEARQPPDMPRGSTDLRYQDETKTIQLDTKVSGRNVIISATLSKAEEEELLETLRKNGDIFAWNATDLRGVNRDTIEHALDTNAAIKPRKQNQRKMSEDRMLAAKAEVQRLLDAAIIREVKYPEWLANVVLVPKKNGKMRMCIDFTDLNKACKKDPFPLPRIDASVDMAARCKRFSLLDCFSGYHQIWLKKEDEEKASFRTPGGTYCFMRMPEGLKNAGATFARMTAKVFKNQIMKNMIAYVDDIVVMSKQESDHIADLQETFANFREANLKLNPEKCVFGVTKGKMLGYIVTAEGIKANPDKISAILMMKEPATTKEVQKLTGKITALNRFISRSAEKSLPFFKTLRSSGSERWGEEQSRAFDQLKEYLSTNLEISVPDLDAPLLLYLAASGHAVSAVLVVEKEEHGKLQQKPVYYVSEVLTGAKLNYSEIEKIVYALVVASRKLKQYFQAHEIRCPTSHPIAEVLRNKEASTRIAKWAIEISQFQLEFIPRIAIKSQVLADFVADWTPSPQQPPQESSQL